MAILTNPSIALAIVQAERRRRGDWGDPTPNQIVAIGGVIRADKAGHLTRDQILVRLYTIAAGNTPQQVAS